MRLIIIFVNHVHVTESTLMGLLYLSCLTSYFFWIRIVFTFFYAGSISKVMRH